MKQKNNTKNITIEYYNTCSFIPQDEKKSTYKRDKMDISLLLKRLKEVPAIQRSINYNGENLLLSSLEFNSQTNLWELLFFKSRSTTIPFITNTQGNSRQILLKDDEMISEALCALYDPSKQVFIMQRNVYAVGTKGIETFFSNFYRYPICLESIHTVTNEKKSLIKRSKIKKFQLKVRTSKGKKAEVSSVPKFNKNTSICKVIDSALEVNSAIINIEFSMGNTSNVINVEEDDFDVFEQLMNNTNVKSLKLGSVPDEFSTMQITDFMDSRIRDCISISYTKGSTIDFSEIFNKMTEKYEKNLLLE